MYTTMEEWKLIEGYENYEVSSHGRVRNNKTGRILKPKIHHDGYLRIGIYKNNIQKFYQIHRLVGSAFIPNLENKPQIDHIDNNPENNSVYNLRWVTYHENNVRRECIVNAKCIYYVKKKDIYQITYHCNGIRHGGYSKTLEEAEAVLANWKTMYPHNII